MPKMPNIQYQYGETSLRSSFIATNAAGDSAVIIGLSCSGTSSDRLEVGLR